MKYKTRKVVLKDGSGARVARFGARYCIVGSNPMVWDTKAKIWDGIKSHQRQQQSGDLRIVDVKPDHMSDLSAGHDKHIDAIRFNVRRGVTVLVPVEVRSRADGSVKMTSGDQVTGWYANRHEAEITLRNRLKTLPVSHFSQFERV